MLKLSVISDEISPKLSEQIELLKTEHVKYLELRSIDGKNILDFSNTELAAIKQQLLDNHLQVSCISSPIGKVKLDADFDAHFERFKRAIEIAKLMNTTYIRIFGYYLPEGDHQPHQVEIKRRLLLQTKLAEENGIMLLLENEDASLYGGTPEEVIDIMESIHSPHLKFLFDAGNYGYFFKLNPYPEFFQQTMKYIGYMHIKDCNVGADHFCVAGAGEMNFPSILSELKETGYAGFLSLEPHLKRAGTTGGFSGIEAVRDAIRALKEINSQTKTGVN